MKHHDPAGADAKSACTDLVLGFAYLVDQRRYDELCNLFVPDGVFERPGLRAEGHENILAFLNARPVAIETRHVCAPPFFEQIGKDRARAVTYVNMFQGPAKDDSTPIDIAGIAGVVEFHQTFTHTGDGWRIAHHESRVAMVTTR